MSSTFDDLLNSDFIKSVNDTILQTQQTIKDSNDIDYSACKREKELRDQEAAAKKKEEADNKLKKKINTIVDGKNDEIMKKIKNIIDKNTTYKNVLISSKNIIELYYNYYNKNNKLEEEIGELNDIIRANERKVYYNEPETNNTQKWNFFLKISYLIIFIIFCFVVMFIYSDSILIKIIFFITFLVYPFIFMFFIRLTINCIKYIISLFPTTVYTSVKGISYN